MSRDTLNDGITLDNYNYDEELRDLAPPSRLVGAHYRGLPWEKFVKRYTTHLKSQEPLVRQLAQRALSEDLTLLCIEKKGENCHRVLLAERCQQYEPSLQVIHR